MSIIRFHTEDVDFHLPKQNSVIAWIDDIIVREGKELSSINYIFCSDKYLLEINKKYLAKNYFTDIITFNNSEDNLLLEGDIFISIDRVMENSKDLNFSFSHELSRVMIHGILHLLGYKDETEAQKSQMRKKEEDCLSLLK